VTREPVTARVISASRRTDIPAHYTEWLLYRLKAGRCTYFHAMAHRWMEADLRPEAVRAIVLWSKNLRPLLPHLDRIACDYPFACHLTITGLPASLEPASPPWREAVAQAREVSERFSVHHVIWRFDPIVLTPENTWERTLETFGRLAGELEGVVGRCLFSFMQVYGKVERRLRDAGIAYEDPPQERRREMALALQAVAAQHGLAHASCCVEGLGDVGIARGRCIDPEVLERVGMRHGPALRPAPSREGCGCYQSTDIGMFDTCPSGCVFCYANTGREGARRAFEAHDPMCESLKARGTGV